MKRHALLLTAACLFHQQHAQAQTDRVIGGSTAENGQFPWMVEMLFLNNEHLCGGTLIHPSWVLTAGHCAIIAEDADMRLVANSIVNILGSAGPDAEELVPDLVVYHPDYDGENGPDLALIRLAQAATTAPVPMLEPAVANDLVGGDSALVLGWGTADTATGAMADTLRFATVGLVDFETCEAMYQSASYDFFGFNGTPGLICAGSLAGGSLAGTGNGDSGGPLLVMHQGQLQQVGVVYGGEGAHVTEAYPGIFTTIAHNWAWIQSVIGNTSTNTLAPVAELPIIRSLPEHLSVVFSELPRTGVRMELLGTDGRVLATTGLHHDTELVLTWPTGHPVYLLRISDRNGSSILARVVVRPA